MALRSHLHLLLDGLEVVALVPQLALELVGEHIERLPQLLKFGLRRLALLLAFIRVLVRVPLERRALVRAANFLFGGLAAHALDAQQCVQVLALALLDEELGFGGLLEHALVVSTTRLGVQTLLHGRQGLAPALEFLKGLRLQ